MNTARYSIALPGLDGSNPLAFLAALGVLRGAGAHAQLRWSGSFRPIVCIPEPGDLDALCQRLAEELIHTKIILDDYPEPGEIVKAPATAFRDFATASDGGPIRYALAAAFGCDGIRDAKDHDFISPTRLSLANGNGGKKLLLHFRMMVDSATTAPPTARGKTRRKAVEPPPSLPQLVREALTDWAPREPEKYYSFRWDPAELRRGAHMATKPEDDPYSPVPAANLLAVLGLTLIPSAPMGEGLRTACMFDREGRELFAWPLWDVPLSAEATTSLLVHPGPCNSFAFAPHWTPSCGVFARFAAERYSDPQKNAYFNTSFAI